MSSLGQTMNRAQRSERRQGLQILLARPLLREADSPEDFALVLRHRLWLVEWFDRHCGWRLQVRRRARIARLEKRPGRCDDFRGIPLAGTGLFDRRRYALLCLLLAELDEQAGQTTLARLVDGLCAASRETEGLAEFQPELRSERKALVDVLRHLESLGVLRLRDGQSQRYVQQQSDALYDVDESLLGQLLICDRPPSLVDGPHQLFEETWADSAEGRTRRAHQEVMRRLVDDPVCYFEDLDDAQVNWVERSWGWLQKAFEEELGLPIERRAEGLAAVDREGRVSDLRFPDGASTVKHAALLLCELLAEHTDRGRRRIPTAQVEDWMGKLQDEVGKRCRWSKAYPADRTGARALSRDALDLLASFNLLSEEDEFVRARAAMARFKPGSSPS